MGGKTHNARKSEIRKSDRAVESGRGRIIWH